MNHDGHTNRPPLHERMAIISEQLHGLTEGEALLSSGTRAELRQLVMVLALMADEMEDAARTGPWWRFGL